MVKPKYKRPFSLVGSWLGILGGLIASVYFSPMCTITMVDGGGFNFVGDNAWVCQNLFSQNLLWLLLFVIPGFLIGWGIEYLIRRFR